MQRSGIHSARSAGRPYLPQLPMSRQEMNDELEKEQGSVVGARPVPMEGFRASVMQVQLLKGALEQGDPTTTIGAGSLVSEAEPREHSRGLLNLLLLRFISADHSGESMVFSPVGGRSRGCDSACLGHRNIHLLNPGRSETRHSVLANGKIFDFRFSPRIEWIYCAIGRVANCSAISGPAGRALLGIVTRANLARKKLYETP